MTEGGPGPNGSSLDASTGDRAPPVGERYRLVRELGRGGMGVVYLGHDTRLDMDVAIKFRGVSHADATLWIKREFRAVSSLRHPNLVELYELVAHERSVYFTMEYLPGVDPRRWVEQPRARRSTREALLSQDPTHYVVPLADAHTEATEPVCGPPTSVFARPVPTVDFARVRTVVAQLAEGLAFLHAHGVIHRDVKPSNAIVVDGLVKLLDFGLALEPSRRTGDVAPEDRVVGTAAYLAPEYLERLAASPAMDVYALGVLAHELCTGAPPLGGAVHAIARLHHGLPISQLSEINAAVPRDLDELVQSLLALDPAARPTAAEVATRLVGSSGPVRVTRRGRRCVGRDRELDRLSRSIADSGTSPRLAVIRGPSGSGKTAVLDELVARAQGDGILVWRGRCHERERLPYRAFDQIVDDLATNLAADRERAAGLPHLAALARVFPVLAPMLPPAALDEPAAADLRVERQRALGSITRLIARLVSHRIAVIAIDDLQWADADSLELLDLLVATLDVPLTFVVTFTTSPSAGGDAAPTWLSKRDPAVDVIDLPPLDAASLAVIIGDLVPGMPLSRVNRAAELAAGSPYLAELIGQELADGAVANPNDAEVRRIERLGADERRITEITALAGGAASFHELRAVGELSSVRLASVLRALEHARIVRATPSTSGEPGYVVYHQRLREAVIATTTADERCALHARFATWLELGATAPAQLAYHWQEARQPARAARWAVLAGDAARAQLAWRLAADWYVRARTLGDDGPAVRAKIGDCLFLAGDLEAAATEFLGLAAIETDVDRGDSWRVRAAEAYLKLGDVPRGLAVLDDVLARRGAPRARHRALSIARAARVAARWIVPVRARPTDDVLPAAYRVLASFLSTPYPIESFEYVLRGVAASRASGDRASHAMGMAMLAAYVATGSLGRFGDRAIANAHRLCTDSGAQYPRMVASGASGMLATLRGNWRGMRVAHEDAERVCRRIGLERSWEASFLRTYWAMGELYAGEPARALEILQPMDQHSEDLWTRAMLGSCRGRVLVLGGDLDGARRQAAELERSPAARDGLASIYRDVFAGELALAEHRWRDASEIASDLARSARAQWLSTMPAISAMVDVIAATAALGRAASKDRGAAHEAMRIARRLHRRGAASFYAPTALRVWAQAALMMGDDARARTLLARAGSVAADRGGNVDRLAIRALTGGVVDCGELGPAVCWSTGGLVTPNGEHGWQVRSSSSAAASAV